MDLWGDFVVVLSRRDFTVLFNDAKEAGAEYQQSPWSKNGVGLSHRDVLDILSRNGIRRFRRHQNTEAAVADLKELILRKHAIAKGTLKITELPCRVAWFEGLDPIKWDFHTWWTTRWHYLAEPHQSVEMKKLRLHTGLRAADLQRILKPLACPPDMPLEWFGQDRGQEFWRKVRNKVFT